ncbi:hypothetical protein J1614_010595 [Plenodomus biglobosus]|nr:hypothetical protein J1614_010595 [Plenodomus biglobosus]
MKHVFGKTLDTFLPAVARITDIHTKRQHNAYQTGSKSFVIPCAMYTSRITESATSQHYLAPINLYMASLPKRQ